MGKNSNIRKTNNSNIRNKENTSSSIKNDIVDLLDEIMLGKYSNIQLNYYFTRKSYSRKEKDFITNLINTTLKNLIFIDYILDRTVKNIQKRKIRQLLRISVAQILFMDSDNEGIVYEAVETAKGVNPHQASFVNATLQSILRNKEEIIESIPSDKKEGILYSYPQWLVNKLKSDFPESYLDIMKSYKERSFLSVRYDRNKVSFDNFKKILSEVNSEILFSLGEVHTLNNANIFATKEYKEGDIMIQDPSSYLAVKNLDVAEGDKVLDACAAPGGKSLAILQLFNPDLLVATDIYPHKIKILEDIKEKYGYDNLLVKANDATEIENLGMKFDRILLDVPCSGLGVLRKKPEKIYTLTLENIKNIKRLQKRIFDSAYTSLKDGGIIIYSTCTFTRNENTNNLATFLEKYSDLSVEDIDIPDNVHFEKDIYGGCYITYENRYMDGFYIVKIRKGKGENIAGLEKEG